MAGKKTETKQKEQKPSETSEKIFLGSDHAGYELKEMIEDCIDDLDNYSVEDLGVFSEKSSDYPDTAKEVAQRVLKTKNSRGILVCGSGIGMSIAANRFKGIRAALCRDANDAKMSREHNNSNVLCLGGRVTDEAAAKRIVDTWLKTKFAGEERHLRRVKKMDNC